MHMTYYIFLLYHAIIYSCKKCYIDHAIIYSCKKCYIDNECAIFYILLIAFIGTLSMCSCIKSQNDNNNAIKELRKKYNFEKLVDELYKNKNSICINIMRIRVWIYLNEIL